MSSLLATPPGRILLTKLGHIGDVLVITPVITALKEACPQAEVYALVNQGTEQMLMHNPLLAGLYVLRRDIKGAFNEAVYQLKLIRELRAKRFDLSLELSGGDRGAFLCWISGARLRVGFEPKKPHMRAKAFHRMVFGGGTQNHMVETFFRQVRELGIEPVDIRLKFQPGRDADSWAEAKLAELKVEPGGYALVHPTSRWMFKTWTPEKVAGVISHMMDRGLKVLLTGGPDSMELAYNREVLGYCHKKPGLFDLSGELDLYRLGALIKKARVFFGMDSAPMHMAAALEVPVLTMFGPSGEKMWGPWQTKSRVLTWHCHQGERPCGKDGCNGTKISRCLVDLPLENAVKALDDLLAETAA